MVKVWLAILAVLIGLGFSDAANTGPSPLSADKRWQQALGHWAHGKAAEAKSAVEELLEEYPKDADLHLLLGMAKLRLRDPQGAILAAKRAVALNPQHIDALTFLGWIELEVRGDPDAAISEYRRVIEVRPDLPEAYANLAAAQKRRGNLHEALAGLNKALEIQPNFATALNNRGWIYVEQEQWARARGDFERTLRVDPQDQGALQGMARVLEKERNYAAAQDMLARLNARSPNFVYWLQWGRIGLIRYWWVLLALAIALALRARFKKARMEANG